MRCFGVWWGECLGFMSNMLFGGGEVSGGLCRIWLVLVYK